MKKVLVLMMLMMLVACSGGETAKTETQPTEEAQVEQTPTPAPVAEAKVEAEVSTPVVPAMKDWSSMILGGAKCVQTTEGQTATVYFKGGKVRMDTAPVDAHAIFDSETMYAWSGKQGTKMSMKDLEAMGQKAQGQYKSPDQLETEMQNPDVNCVATSVSDDLFVPPAGIEFMDLAAMMQQQYGVMPNGMPQQ